MHHENCEDMDSGALLRKVPLVALFATVVGAGACARRRQHRRDHEGAGRWGGLRHGRAHHFEHHEDDGLHWGEFAGAAKRRMDPLRILERRFAIGEIDEDEFRRRRRVLMDDGR